MKEWSLVGNTGIKKFKWRWEQGMGEREEQSVANKNLGCMNKP